MKVSSLYFKKLWPSLSEFILIVSRRNFSSVFRAWRCVVSHRGASRLELRVPSSRGKQARWRDHSEELRLRLSKPAE